jgi:hypothetical protein
MRTSCISKLMIIFALLLVNVGVVRADSVFDFESDAVGTDPLDLWAYTLKLRQGAVDKVDGNRSFCLKLSWQVVDYIFPLGELIQDSEDEADFLLGFDGMSIK